MSLNDSNRRAEPQSSGFSLLEVLVALVSAVILLTVVVRFYKDSYRSYSLQEQITERNQNLHYTIKKLTELLQQAGAALPDTGWDSVLVVSGSWLKIGSNPTGGFSNMSTTPPTTGSLKIPVGDSLLFVGASYVLVDYASSSQATVRRKISGSKKSHVTGIPDTLTIATALPVILDTGAVIYPYNLDSVGLASNNFMFDSVVLAENIDSLAYTFYKPNHTSTTDWNAMRSAYFFIRARTAMSDPNYSPTNGYRKIADSMNVLLRNKI